MLCIGEPLRLQRSHLKKTGLSKPFFIKPMFAYIVIPQSQFYPQLHWKGPSHCKHNTSHPPQQLFSDNTMINLLFLLYSLKNPSFVSMILTDGPPWWQKQTVYLNDILFFYNFIQLAVITHVRKEIFQSL